MARSQRDRVILECSAKPGSVEDYPFGDEVAVFKWSARCSRWCPLGAPPGSVSFRCDPELAVELRGRIPRSRLATTSVSATTVGCECLDSAGGGGPVMSAW